MYFGKLCTIFVCLISLLSACNSLASIEDSQLTIKALKEAHLALAAAVVDLEKNSKACRKSAEIDAVSVKSRLPKYKKEQLRLALMYIQQANFIECISPQETALISSAIRLENLIEKSKSEDIKLEDQYVSGLSSVRTLVVGTSAEFAVLKQRYLLLPAHIRNEFEAISDLQGKHFDVFKLIEKLGL